MAKLAITTIAVAPDQQGTGVGGQNVTSGTAQPGIGGGQENQGFQDSFGRRNRRRRGSDDEDTVTTGPILGVHSKSDDEAIKKFLDGDKYSSWLFTPDIIPIAPTAPGEIVPSLNSKWVGRPFPEGFEPTGGTGIEDSFGNEDQQDKRDRRKDERKRRRRGGG